MSLSKAVRIQSRGRSVYISPKSPNGKEKFTESDRKESGDVEDVLDIHLQT